MSTKQYRKDVAECKVFEQFMDKLVYPNIAQAVQDAVPGSIFDFSRYTSMNEQYAGYDVLFSTRNGKTNEGGIFRADEKAQLHKLNEPIPSFCFELSYLKQGRETPGWFVDPRKKSDAYILCWPRGVAEHGNIYTGATVRILFKKDVEDYVARYGYTADALVQKAKEIRQSGGYGRINATERYHGFHFTFTKAKGSGGADALYGEEMINLIISERQLETLANASIKVDYNWETDCMDIQGYFGGLRFNRSYPVPYNIYSISLEAREGAAS